MKHQNIFKFAGLACCIASAVAINSCGEKKETTSTRENEAQQTLRFSAIPDQDTTAQAERYAPAAKWLSDQLGIKVEFIPSSDYAASVDKFTTGDIQLAWFGGVSGIQARNEVPRSRAIVSGAKDLQFKSYFIAHESTGLEKSEAFPDTLNQLTFTFGSSGSTSGSTSGFTSGATSRSTSGSGFSSGSSLACSSRATSGSSSVSCST